MLLVMTLNLEGLTGYGDLPNYFQLAQLPGLPFINYWVEFPPVFPFLNSLIFHLSGGLEPNYDYLFVFFLIFVDAANLILFAKISDNIHGIQSGQWRMLSYLAILIAFSYTWWYFDSLVVFAILLGLYLLHRQRDLLAGGAIAFGALTKFFPLALLAMVWCFLPIKRALKVTISAVALIVLAYGSLYLVSPSFTRASLISQLNKGSWETVWALIDGNLQTGLFGPYSEKLIPELANETSRNPPVINPLISLIFFGGIGFWIFLKPKERGLIQVIAFTGLTLCLTFLWSPGWSPQWVLFLIPLILLSLARREALLMTATIVLVNVLEWPVLLSRGLFNDLWITVILRTLILILLALTWFTRLNPKPIRVPVSIQP